MNGIDIEIIDENEMEAITLAVADGSADKNAAIEFFAARISIAE
jgi:hypothetical protein